MDTIHSTFSQTELLLMAGFTIPAFQNSLSWENNTLLQIMVYMMTAEYTLTISRS